MEAARTAGTRKFIQDQMPSKKYNGNSPLGSTRLQGSGSLADAELEIAKRTPKQSMTTGLIQTPSGAIHAPKRTRRVTAGTSEACILGKMSVDTENSTEQSPKKKLSVGFISGGGGSESVVIDNLTATIDDYVYIQVAWTGSTLNGVLQAGGTMGAVTSSQGATAPNDTTPTASTPAGSATIVLGQWLSDGADEPSPVWYNQGCGSIQLYFCPGNGFFFGRDNTVEQAIDIL